MLCEPSPDGLTLNHMHSGESISLRGVFADRFLRHLDSPGTEPFPNLGLPAGQHPWLKHLHPAPQAADLLLANGLGMLFIELTDQCNESCIHCYAESSPLRSARLSRSEILRVLQQARQLGKPAVQFTGGDPLLHADLLFGVQTARELGYEPLEIYTNGLALSPSLLQALLPHRPAFSFSIYSADPTIHDHITQHPGSLLRTIKAMQRVQQAGLPLRVGIILMPENKGTEDASIAFLQQELGLHATQIGIDMVRSTGRGAFMRDYRPDMSRLQPFRHRADIPPDASAASRDAAIPLRRGKLCISATGDVYPCIFSRHSVLGNIRKQSLAEILAGLGKHGFPAPSATRWQHCKESLSCSDCQAIAYLLGNGDGNGQTVIPIMQGEINATTRTS